MKKRKKKNKNYIILIITFIVFTTIILTIGYSSFSTELDINNLTAIARIQKDIRVNGISVDSVNSNGISNWENHDVNRLLFNIDLPSSTSTVTYTFEVVNLGNVEATITEISGLPENLKYTLNNFTLGDALCDDTVINQCTLGSVSTVEITISYDTGGYDSSETEYTVNLELTFSYLVDAVAKMGNRYFDTLQEAITAAPNNESATIILLKNTSEIISIGSAKNINLNLNGNTLSNSGNNPVISNLGTLNLFGGYVTTNASTNGAINNESTGTIYLSGGRVVVTGGRQALYNNAGIATISGGSYLISGATERATVQNVTGGTMTILDATIISTGSYAVNNASTLTIGTKDGNLSTTTPLFQSVNIGINTSTNMSFYDGIVKSKVDAFSAVNRVTDMETGYGLVSGSETINGETYKTTYLGISKAVNFNANGGTVSETRRYVEVGHEVGPLPTPIRSGYIFQGWFTSASGTTQIDEHVIINNTVTFWAHWEKTSDVAIIGNTLYPTLQDAINAVPTDNTPTTITIRKDISEYMTVASGQNIIFDFDGYTLTNSGNKPIFETSGTIDVSGCKIITDAAQSAINVLAGRVTMNSGEITATGTKQAVYITGGTVVISGTSYLSSLTSGKPSGSNMERGTVHNVSGTLIITGGTIVGSNQQAVSNQATLTIGTKDGTIDDTTPELIGKVYGLKSTGTFNFYDGIIKGKTDAINGTISDQETLSTIITGTEVINNATYKTAKLQLTP